MPEVQKTTISTGAGDVRPVPDPTALTTQQLNSAIASLREILETRLNGMDKAIELLQAYADKLPKIIDEKIKCVNDVEEEKFHVLSERFRVQDEKFRSIQTQFTERDVRTEQTARDAKTAVDAALQAAKEAVGKQNDSFAIATQKSEQGFTKQIDQLVELFRTTTKGLEDKISEVKERFNRRDGEVKGTADAKTEQRSVGSYMVSIFGLITAVVLGVAGIVVAIILKQ